MQETPNLNYIHQLSGGDIGFEEQLLDVIRKELPDEISTYVDHFTSGESILAAADVHKLKHKISILGLEKAYELAIEHEEYLKTNRYDLHDSFMEVLRTMTDFVEQLKKTT